MDPSDLVPGLAEMLEYRLGRFGYHLGTLVGLAVAVFLLLLPVGAVIVIIKPFVDKGLGSHIAVVIVEWVGIAAIFCIALFVLYRMIYALSPRNKVAERQVTELLVEVDGLKARLRKYEASETSDCVK